MYVLIKNVKMVELVMLMVLIMYQNVHVLKDGKEHIVKMVTAIFLQCF